MMTNSKQPTAVTPLTGRKVLFIALTSFGAIIVANLTLAYSAVQSFPGIEVNNGYIASQSFERDRAAQEKLGWTSKATYSDGKLTLMVQDPNGGAASLLQPVFQLGRPTTAAADLTMARLPEGTGWTANLTLAPGPWRLDISGQTADGDRFRQHLMVEGGR